MRIIGLDPMLLGLFGLSALAVVTAEDLSRRAVPAQQDEATEEETNRLDIGGHLAVWCTWQVSLDLVSSKILEV